MPLLDTRRGKDLMGTFLSDIVFQVLGFVAENERVNIRQWQVEGIAAAKARGVRFGRLPSPLSGNFHSAYQRWKAKKITGTAAVEECVMALFTFRYRAAIYEKARLCNGGCFCRNVYLCKLFKLEIDSVKNLQIPRSCSTIISSIFVEKICKGTHFQQGGYTT